jgi:hypothetical protein
VRESVLKRLSLRRERRPGHTELVRRSNNSTRGSADLVIDMDRSALAFFDCRPLENRRHDLGLGYETSGGFASPPPTAMLIWMRPSTTTLNSSLQLPNGSAHLRGVVREKRYWWPEAESGHKIKPFHVGRNVTVSHESNTSSEKSGDEKSVLGSTQHYLSASRTYNI